MNVRYPLSLQKGFLLMIISISIAIIAILFALTLRFIIIRRFLNKTPAGWLSMIIAIIAIIAEGFALKFQGENTVITGFCTMIFSYMALTYQPKLIK